MSSAPTEAGAQRAPMIAEHFHGRALHARDQFPTPLDLIVPSAAARAVLPPSAHRSQTLRTLPLAIVGRINERKIRSKCCGITSAWASASNEHSRWAIRVAPLKIQDFPQWLLALSLRRTEEFVAPDDAVFTIHKARNDTVAACLSQRIRCRFLQAFSSTGQHRSGS